jgi:hypothetical protein
MGACEFFKKGYGKSMQEVYSRFVEDAENEYGHDAYNGTISTTRGFLDVTNQWQRSKKPIEEFVLEMLDNCPTRYCYGVCIKPPVKNTAKIKSSVENIVLKGTTKWELKYKVRTWGDEIGCYDTKGEAIKKAREYTERTQESTSIYMEKVLAKKDNSLVAKVTYKKSGKESPGYYYFFGLASE